MNKDQIKELRANKFQKMIDDNCDCLETFVGVNRMTHRHFGEWVFDIQEEKITQLEKKNTEFAEAVDVIKQFVSCMHPHPLYHPSMFPAFDRGQKFLNKLNQGRKECTKA